MVRVTALLTSLLCLLSSATAADGSEFMPFAGYRFGGAFDEEGGDRTLDVEERGNWGFAFSAPASSTTRYEFLYSRQETRLTDQADPRDAFDLDIHYLQLGGTLDLPKEKVVPFFSGGVGLIHMRPGRGGYTSETRFSLSLGGGFKWYLTERLGLRFEMRGYGTLMDTSGALFCDGGCELRLRSDLFPQFETNLGLVFRF